MAVLHDTPADGTFSAAGALHWDADHTVDDDTFVAAKLSATDDTILFGRATAGAGAGEEIIIGTNLSLTGNTLNAAAGSSTWDTIGNAAGDATTANGDWNIVANWRKTTDSETAFTFGETLASTGGTITAGTIFNQVLLRLTTLAGSTMSPFVVFARGTQAFAINSISGQSHFQDGTALLPAITFTFDDDTGFYQPSNGQVAISCDGAQSVFWGTSGHFASLGSANATAYALNIRKSRGTVASPTVITTGDDLATVSGFGYVGATGTYVEGCRITFDSTGTIANTTSGLGGIMRLACAVVGTVGPVEIAQVNGTEQHLLHVGTVPAITAGGGTDPTIAGTDEAFTITVGSGGIALTVTVTFAKAFTVAPRCTANHQGAVLILRCVSTTTTVTIDAATPFTASGLIDVICRSGTT